MGALSSGYRQYASGGTSPKSKKQLESETVDPATFFVQLSHDAAFNLDGFKMDAKGLIKSSRERRAVTALTVVTAVTDVTAASIKSSREGRAAA